MTVVRGTAQSTGEAPTPAPTATGTPIQPMAPTATEDPTKRADQPAPEVKASGAGTPPKDPAKKEGEPKVEPKKEDDAASRFAVLARREAKLVKDSQAIKAERDAIAAEKAKLEADRLALEHERKEEEELWKKDPLEVIKKRGSSYEDLTKRVLGREEEKPIDPVEAAKAAARDELAAQKKRDDEAAEKKRVKDAEDARAAAAKELEEARADWRKNFSETMKKPELAEKYELVNLYPDIALDIAQELVEQHMVKAKKLLTDEEAATLVEEYLYSELEKGTKTKKFQAKAQPQPKEEKKQPLEKVKVDDPSESAKPRTLTSRLAPSSTPKVAPRPWEERLERARAVGRK
jgi:hypothetical protein